MRQGRSSRCVAETAPPRPAAGPDTASLTGRSASPPTETTPRLLWMSSIGEPSPSLAQARLRESRYRQLRACDYMSFLRRPSAERSYLPPIMGAISSTTRTTPAWESPSRLGLRLFIACYGKLLKHGDRLRPCWRKTFSAARYRSASNRCAFPPLPSIFQPRDAAVAVRGQDRGIMALRHPTGPVSAALRRTITRIAEPAVVSHATRAPLPSSTGFLWRPWRPCHE